jgi:flagellar basal-body rod modification protein FlgD
MSTLMVNPLAAPPDAAVNAASAASNLSASAASSNATSADSLSTEFLQLLIAQLKNQDPETPTDGTAFVTQLAQFTSVEQETQSSTDLGSILSLLQQAAISAASGTAANPANAAAGTPATAATASAGTS